PGRRVDGGTGLAPRPRRVGGAVHPRSPGNDRELMTRHGTHVVGWAPEPMAEGGDTVRDASDSGPVPPGRADFVVVANRLPLRHTDGDEWELSPGGLVSALLPVMRERRGSWVGWDGSTAGETHRFDFEGITLAPVALSAGEVDDYY